MKPLILTILLFSILGANAQKEVISTATFGPLRVHPRVDRKGRYGDSARMFMTAWQRPGLSRDSNSYYKAMMRAYREMESERQYVVQDSGWRSELRQYKDHWHPLHSGKQDISLINRALQSYIMRAFIASGDRLTYDPGEYVPMMIDLTTGIFLSFSGDGIPSTIPGAPANAAVALGGPHNGAGLTANGQLWMYGQWALNGQSQTVDGIKQGVSTSSMVQITTDSSGNYLDPIAQGVLSGNSYGAFWTLYFVTTTGKMYGGGELEGGGELNGTWGNPWASRPVQIVVAGNPFFTKVQGGYCVVAMDSAGNGYTGAGGGYAYYLGQGNNPTWKNLTKINLPTGYKVFDIASNGSYTYFLVHDASGGVHIYMCAEQYFEDTVGIYPGGTVTTSFQDITSPLANATGSWAQKDPGHYPKHIYVSCNSSYVIMDNGWLFGWGGTPCGEMGTGQQLNWWTNGPFFWNFGPHECQQLNPIRIAPGVRNFETINTCLSNSFYVELEDSAGTVYSVGRNKGQAQPVCLPQDSTTVMVNAAYVNGGVGEDYPDSWEEGHIRVTKPAAITKNLPIHSPYCDSFPNATNCNLMATVGHGTAGGSLTGSYSGSAINLSAYGKTSTRIYTRFLWTQDSVHNPVIADLGTAAEATVTITTAQDGPLHTGGYKFYWLGITNGNDSVRDSISVSVGSVPPTVTISGGAQFLYLPVTSTTLVGSATGNGGATITGYAWTQVSGPNTATFGSATSSTTTATGLIVGAYVFKLTATDSNGNTNFATVAVTVLNVSALSTQYPILISH